MVREVYYNDIPDELKEKAKPFPENGIAKFRINPIWFTSVQEQRGTGEVGQNVTFSGTTQKVGTHEILGQWPIRYKGKTYNLGFIDGETMDGPTFRMYSNDSRGNLYITKNDNNHEEHFLAIQFHPQMRFDPITGEQRKNWKWEYVDEEAAGEAIITTAERELALSTLIMSELTTAQLDLLVKPMYNGIAFFNQPSLIGKPKGIKAFLYNKVKSGEKGFREVEQAIARMNKALEVDLVKEGLQQNHLIWAKEKISLANGKVLFEGAMDIPVSVDDKAKTLFDTFGRQAWWKDEMIPFLSGYASAANSKSKPASK